MAIKHSLTNVNEDALVGDCLVCGPSVRVRKSYAKKQIKSSTIAATVNTLLQRPLLNARGTFTVKTTVSAVGSYLSMTAS